MPVISKRQVFAITKGFLAKSLGGTATQTFTPISPGTLLATSGIDITNSRLPGLGDPASGVFTVAVNNETVAGNVIARLGGDITGDSTLSNVERDYHLTGQYLIRKLK